jgi:hypothetical protein
VDQGSPPTKITSKSFGNVIYYTDICIVIKTDRQMEYVILTSHSPHSLTNQVNDKIKDGWKPVGGHGVVVTLSQNKFSGLQHTRTEHQTEYSQTMIKE